MTPAQLLDRAETLLLDFDGPLASLMPSPANALAADRVRRALAEADLPVEMIETTDHLALLRWAKLNTPERIVHDVEEACTGVEVEAAEVCDPGWHARALIEFIRSRGLDISAAVVSNNSDLAVRKFLNRLGWLDDFGAIACRTSETIDWMKPKPALLNLALDMLHVDAHGAVMIGDSVGDVVAGKAAGVAILGLAKNAARAEELAQAGADVVADLRGGDIYRYPKQL